MALPYPTVSRTWDLGTSADGRYWATEFAQLYANDNYLGDRITSPVAWTPTFTGFGTVSGVVAYSWRIGSCLFFEIRWTPGTTTATEARVSLGFNGVDGNVTLASNYPSNLQSVGVGAFNSVSSVPFPLASPGLTYLTIGMKDSGNVFAPLENRQAGNLATSGQGIALSGCVRIQGW